MRRAVLLLVVLGLATGGYFLWRARSEPEATEAASMTREAPTTEPEPLRLEGRVGERPLSPAPAATGEQDPPPAVPLPAGISIHFPEMGSARARGRVVDADGKPVAGAHVHAAVADADSMPFGLADSMMQGPGFGTDTGPDGRFELATLAEGKDYDLVATTPTTYRGTAGPFTASLEKPIEAEIRLPPPRWLDVRVVDAAGKAPLAGASVRWSSADAPRTEGIWHLVADRVGEMQGNPKTDANGMIRVGPLPPAALEFSASAKGYVRSPAPVPVAADAQGPVELALEKGLTIDGSVVRPDGSPAVAAELMFRPAAPSGLSMPNLAKSDERGAFHLDGLAPGRYRIDASVDDLRGSVVAEAGDRDVWIPLTPNAGRPVDADEEPTFPLRIRAVGADGSPVPTADVSVQGGSFWTTSRLTKGEVQIEAPSLPVGAFVVVSGAVAEDGTRLPWGQTRYGPLKDGETDVTVRLVPARTLEGRVLDVDGSGIPQVKVGVGGSMWSFGSDGMSARTRADGSFTLNGLGDDEYDVRADPPSEFLPADAVKARGGDRGVTIRLRRGVRPTVTVVDAKGDPVAGAVVYTQKALPGADAHDAPEALFFTEDPFDQAPKTRADGRVRLNALEPGVAVRLVVEPPAHRSDLGRARLDRWVPADVSVPLPPGFVVRGRVQDAAGKPVPNVMVQAGSADGRASHTSTGDDGSFEMRGLPAGRVTVRVYLGGGMPSLDRFDPDAKGDAEAIADVGTKEVLLVVSRRASLRVVVEDASTARGQELTVTVSAGEDLEMRSLGADGTTDVDGLAADGTYAVFVGTTSDGRTAYRTGVRPGDGELRLRLATGKTVTGKLALPAGAAEASAWVYDPPVVAQGVVQEDGRYEIRGLPDGTWTVNAAAKVGDHYLTGSVRVAAGSSADIEVK